MTLPFRLRSIASLALIASQALTAFACSGGTAPSDASDIVSDRSDVTTGDASDATDAVADAPDANRAWSSDCDPLVEQACALPWPSNLYLVPDTTRVTGYSIRFGAHTLPTNTLASEVQPEPFTRMDGYGLGTPIMAVFPNVDTSQMATEDHIERSMDPNATALLFEVQGSMLVQVPYLVELDGHETDPTKQILYMRPAVILKEATQYVVAFRNLQDTHGAPIAPSRAFQLLRDGMASTEPTLAPRQARFDAMFTLLEAHGIPRSSLTLAWDFNTASGDALHGRLLHMRDDALAMMPQGPMLTVTNVTQYIPADDGSGRMVNADIALELTGTFQVPTYMKPRRYLSYTTQQFNLDANGVPTVNGMVTEPFWIRIPYSALATPAVPHALLQYGHGLFGEGNEVQAGYLGHLANVNHYILFAANQTGMSAYEIPYVLDALTDLNNFTAIGDMLHQGMVEWVLFARAMQHQFPMLTDVTSRGIQVDTQHVYYSGNSQGGIFGGTYLAISPDIVRGHLGVPGNNYVTLLQRSTDFARFFTTLSDHYPNVEDQAVLLACMQLLWDATEPVSYLRHIHAEPFTAGMVHDVVFTPAKGDHEVAVLTNEIAARSDFGIAIMANYDNQRMPEGIVEQPYPFVGSGVVLFDFGNPWPTPGNHPPDDMLPDPHQLPRNAAEENALIAHFFATGEIVDECNGMGCHYDCSSGTCVSTF